MKTAIYARVSTDEQHAFKQIEVCKKECTHRGFEIYKVYEDVISGSTASRPAFNELLKDMRNYKFNCVMVTKLDRLGRSLQHLLGLFEEFKVKGINFIAVTQNIDTTSASGRLQLQIMGAFAEFERNLISERTKEGLKRAKNKHKIGKRGKDKKPRKRRGTLRKTVWDDVYVKGGY
jgi:putative DNA-invertase from lambdoid prophage Rac